MHAWQQHHSLVYRLWLLQSMFFFNEKKKNLVMGVLQLATSLVQRSMDRTMLLINLSIVSSFERSDKVAPSHSLLVDQTVSHTLA